MPSDSASVSIVPAEKVTHVSGTVISRSNPSAPAPVAQPAKAPTPTPTPTPKPEPTRETVKQTEVRQRPAQDDLYSTLRKRSEPKPQETVEQKPEGGEQSAPEVAATEPKPEGEVKPAEAPAPEGEAKAEKGKVNPWKLVDEYKETRAKLESEIAELRRLLPDESARKAELARLEKAEARAKELEEHIRYVDYSKSKEFHDKFEKPYTDAWKRAMSDLGEVSIEDEASGNTRTIAPKDLLDLVNIPLAQARQKANELYGEYATDVMQHRQEIRRLFDERAAALERAQAEGVEHFKQQQEQAAAQEKEVRDFLTENWRKANEAALADEENGEFFKHAEGDDERNELLTRGYELVDTAFAKNPMDPSLKADERAAIIKRHVAVRNRAAAYGTLKHLLRKEREAHKATLEKLKQYEDSTPTTEGSQTKAAGAGHVRAQDAMFGKLRSLAK